MEVHHYPHPEGKKIRHYLFEFLMLFLAVSAGFFVENIRVFFFKNKTATGLAASLIKDMQKDTAQLNWLIQFDQSKMVKLDSFYELLEIPFSRVSSRIFYHLAKNIQISYAYAPTNGTVNQLKNAGYLRYFSNDSLPGFLSEYDFLYSDVRVTDNILDDLVYNKYYTLLIRNSDARLLHFVWGEKEIPDSTGILPIPAEDLKALKGITTMIRRSYRSAVGAYEDLIKKALQIIEYLRRSLHLK